MKKEEIDFKYNLKVYWSFLSKYKYILLFVLFLVLLFEVSLVVDKFLFKIIIDKGTDFANKLIDINSFIRILIIIVVAYFALLGVRAVSLFFQLHIVNRFEMDLITDLKRKFFNHIVHLSHSFHISHKTGSLISRLVRGGNAIERMTDVIVFNVSPLLFQLIAIMVSLISLNLYSTLIIFLTVFFYILYTFFMQNKQKEINLIRNKKEDIEKAYIGDVMTNIDSVKYFGKEYTIRNKFRQISEATRYAFIKFWDFFRWLGTGQILILGIGGFFLIYFPMLKFLDGELTIGSLVFIYTLFGNIYGPLSQFVHGIRSYYIAMSDFHDLFGYGKIENEIKDIPNAKDLEIIKGEIEFKNITFKYQKRVIFKNFNLKINPHEKVALVGHSGSGKSTLIKLLYRFYNLDEGEILIDGKNINQFKQESLRSELSIVPQECILFDDTIYNNIAFSKQGAKREEIMKAMKFAQMDKVVKEFPKKENTLVGERGVKLSVGEKQRVSIARALLSNKKILVLDEATSSLDSQTEHNIQKDLEKLMKNRTSIIIAHRLSTIMHADKIVVMDKGQIVQIGKHEELIKVLGLYQKLWSLQKGGYIK